MKNLILLFLLHLKPRNFPHQSINAFAVLAAYPVDVVYRNVDLIRAGCHLVHAAGYFRSRLFKIAALLYYFLRALKHLL